MGFPQNVLADDETVVIHQHSHWKIMFWPVVWLLIVCAIAGFGVVWISQHVAQLIIAGVAVLVILYVFVRPLVKWLSTHFILTTHRVLTRSGVLSRRGRDVPLTRINDVSFEQSLFERMFGCGTLIVESAGERGQITLTDVPRVEYVQTTLYRLVDEVSDPRDDPGQ